MPDADPPNLAPVIPGTREPGSSSAAGDEFNGWHQPEEGPPRAPSDPTRSLANLAELAELEAEARATGDIDPDARHELASMAPEPRQPDGMRGLVGRPAGVLLAELAA